MKKHDHASATGRLERAFGLALELHSGQRRKGTEIPYFSHLLAVASLVLEHGGDEDQAITALLHDGPEDAGGEETLERIRAGFGDRVAEIVRECSDTFDTPKPPWKGRKQDYLDRLSEVSAEALLVSLADKVHNVRSILSDYRRLGEGLWERFTGGRDGTLWYYEELLREYEANAARLSRSLLDEYRIAQSELTRLAGEGEDTTSNPSRWKGRYD